MRAARAAIGGLLLCAASAAQAAIADYAERPAGAVAGGYRRFAVTAHGVAGGAPYAIETSLWRPATPPPGGAPLLVETEPEPAAEAAAATDARDADARDIDVRDLAKRRGMTIFFAAPALDRLPEAVRAEALRDLVAQLRKSAGVARVIARGAGRQADFLLSGAQGGARDARMFDGLLLRRSSARVAPLDPKGPRVMETFGSDAFWRDAPRRGEKEAAEGANRRRFFIAGAAAKVDAPTANCAAPANARPIEPALRALLAALDAWIARGAAPPASRVAERGLVAAADLAWPKIPGLPQPPRDARLVPAIDADGNETAGLRLPDHALALGTHTGWNGPKDKAGPPCPFGASLPFAATRSEREKTGDPRPSLVERYGSRAYYVATMRVVADKLVKDRLLLPEDADAYVAAAKAAPF